MLLILTQAVLKRVLHHWSYYFDLTTGTYIIIIGAADLKRDSESLRQKLVICPLTCAALAPTVAMDIQLNHQLSSAVQDTSWIKGSAGFGHHDHFQARQDWLQ